MAKTILLCDDEICILKAAEFKLRNAGYTILTAGDGQEAWERLQTISPDMVISDYQMPRLDGMQLIARMRDHEATRGIPVVMLTAKGLELDQSEIMSRLGIRRFMSKPFSPREMARVVEEIIGPAQVAETVASS